MRFGFCLYRLLNLLVGVVGHLWTLQLCNVTKIWSVWDISVPERQSSVLWGLLKTQANQNNQNMKWTIQTDSDNRSIHAWKKGQQEQSPERKASEFSNKIHNFHELNKISKHKEAKTTRSSLKWMPNRPPKTKQKKMPNQQCNVRTTCQKMFDCCCYFLWKIPISFYKKKYQLTSRFYYTMVSLSRYCWYRKRNRLWKIWFSKSKYL